MTSYHLNTKKFVINSSNIKNKTENESAVKQEDLSKEKHQEQTFKKNEPNVDTLKIKLHSKTMKDSRSKCIAVSIIAFSSALLIFSAIIISVKNSHGTNNLLPL